ncbi:ubiquitin-conjugating enzyme E2 variant 3 isoform X3 [Huso huso]|uniref:Ubiquitin-conjugating enzyme E2 variant 3 isoform X3 n=1 Tax=Huso huso TaxID=61971 RepID=A0ABR0Z8U3_HUSHU
MSSNSWGSGLSRRHGFKCIPDDNVSIEDVLLAVGENIGYSNIKSASRMNKAIVVFLNDEQLVHRVVVEGLTIKEKFVSVLLLSSPITKVILSNVPPFIENEKLARELARFRKLISPIKPILLGCKHPEVKHVLSFRRQTFVLLNDPNSAIDVLWSFNIDGVNYTVFASNELMKCFQCGKQGHLRKFCLDKTGDREGGDNGEPSGVVATGSRKANTAEESGTYTGIASEQSV